MVKTDEKQEIMIGNEMVPKAITDNIYFSAYVVQFN